MHALLRQSAQHHAQPLGVIGVLVRNKKRFGTRRIKAHLFATGKEITLTNTAINHDARAGVSALNNGGVAFRAACQDMKLELW